MHPPEILLELGAVLFGLGLAGLVAHRFAISPIPLYLLAGLAFGEHGPLPIGASEEFIGVGAEIGAVLLLLMLGLEYAPDELVGALRQHAPAGVVDLVVNAVPGVALALLFGWGSVAAVALGGITYVSSSGIVAKLLADLGHLGNRETPVVLSVLVFEDLAMAAYLPVLAALVSGLGVAATTGSVALALVVVGLVFTVALRFPNVLARLVFAPNDEVLLLRVLGLSLLVAGAAARLNISATVGAFLVGLSLSGPVAEGASAILRPLRDLFAAVFFVFFGLQIDPATIPAVAPAAVALAVASAATKVGTGWWAAARAGISSRGRVRAGVALIPRGEFSIVIAALAAPAVAQTEFQPLVATYVLLLAVAAPLTAKLADRSAGHRHSTATVPSGGASTASGGTASSAPSGSPTR